ncbi:P44/Msp2 family outer membrane protein [Neoehrlichia mikurensis]|uniref:P44/Msp2 family outer membrane protein n=1 Tax=Neoehrlichia mikurensis TaxID=89586 RepID=A0A9Q9C113_9RICK|nr:P44/Msp2 family outer membrane protein [Neoehrlichia mikurensis]QXK91598.1 P44/Msp2 family outer membrane protein [Neoehrlichia mikurensis]QXK92809.1 P44/Msp2 family outer membrane protein [Neoehrlichia mikurensis]QXK93288.1 P44/Msp2 family outer membrane protein [Neoehrlichia mikurensis]UTO55770.1 P44/Msp2 family outer membrane protein [Neoehrlichia mikurensis]UTO56687.1 P44/Msp2 family outer membrane protein [Neoehrlichia mikurensis]
MNYLAYIMNQEKIFTIIFTILFFVSCKSYASPNPIDFSTDNESSGFYISGQYKPSYPYFKNFIVIEAENKPLILFAVKKDASEKLPLNSKDNFKDKYDPIYNPNFKGYSLSIGYSVSGPRIEIEGSYEQFLIDNTIYKNQENAKYFALSRSETISDSDDCNYVTAENNGISIYSLTVNTCYDLITIGIPIVPNICVGIGGSVINFLTLTNLQLSYQAKAGLQYFLSPKVIMFINGYAQKLSNTNFKNIPVEYNNFNLKDNPKHISPSAKFDINFFGLECGMRFIF